MLAHHLDQPLAPPVVLVHDGSTDSQQTARHETRLPLRVDLDHRAAMTLPCPTLRTDRLRLRPFEDDDAGELYALMSDAHVLRYWDSPPWTEPARAQTFIDRCRAMADDESGVRPAVERADDGAFLGWVTFTDWDPELRSAELGYVLTEAAWGRGYATEAARAVLTWAYDALPLNRVQSQADTRNPASARVLEKLGFVHEGTLRQDCVVDGVVSDSWVYGLLRSDWTPVCDAITPATPSRGRGRVARQASSVSTSTS